MRKRRRLLYIPFFEENRRLFTLSFVGVASFFIGIIGQGLIPQGLALRELLPFVPLAQNGTLQSKVLIAPQEVSCCFTPTQKCLPLILKMLNQAQSTIQVQAYTFTSRPIAQALVQASNRGIKVTVIADKSQIQSPHSQVQLLHQKGVSVYFDTKPSIAHNKVIIVDESILLVGSYNFSNAAEHRNAENILIINNKEIAQQYNKNFQTRLAISVKNNRKR